MKISFGPAGGAPYNMDLVFKAIAVLFTLLASCGGLNDIITGFFFHYVCHGNTFFPILLHK